MQALQAMQRRTGTPVLTFRTQSASASKGRPSTTKSQAPSATAACASFPISCHLHGNEADATARAVVGKGVA
jgi:hypothetical protein